MNKRITKADFDFLCKTTMDLAFVAQRINRQHAKGGKPKAGSVALAAFKAIDRARLVALAFVVGNRVNRLVECYEAVEASEAEGWCKPVFPQYWRPELYCLTDPTKSMDVESWGVLKGVKTEFVSWYDAPTVPLSYRIAQQGQARTLVDVAKALNDAYHFKTLDAFLSVFDGALSKALERGTISRLAWTIFNELLRTNCDKFFGDRGFDVDVFAKIVEDNISTRVNSPIDHLLVQRGNANLLRIVVLLNDIMHYGDMNGLISDLQNVCKDGLPGASPFGCYSRHNLMSFLSQRWTSLLDAEGRLSNERLEKFVFRNHKNRLEKLSLDDVLAKDFVADGPCGDDSVMRPKRPFSAPTYVKDRFWVDHCNGERRYVRSCGPSCGDEMSPELFEFEVIKPILEREVREGNYVREGRYYLPAVDDSLPVFVEGHGRVAFDGMHWQLAFLKQWRSGGRIPKLGFE